MAATRVVIRALSTNARWRLARWRRAGFRQGLQRGAVVAHRQARGWVLSVWLRRHPISVTDADVGTALGTMDASAALRGPVLAAMPTVRALIDRLAEADEEHRAELLEIADDVLRHRFSLLGSGLVPLGPVIDWHSDFKVGRRWPLRHQSVVPTVYPDASDIKVPWELSRFQHLPVLAAAYQLTGDDEYLNEIGSQLEHWIAANPVQMGPNWACTMEVAIRAANWLATLAMCHDAALGTRWFDSTMRSLLLHARFIRTHLEDGAVRGNHYLSDVVGLLVVSALFSGGHEGRSWADWAVGELVQEMDHQVHPDGVDHEASLAYHRLAAELFICGTHAADALAPGSIPHWYRVRLSQMLQFTADYTRSDGLAPAIGDSDDGRFLPLDDYGREDPRRHAHLFRQAGTRAPAPRRRAAYSQGGFFFLRDAGRFVAARCGPTGVGGRGPHAHNDQLSFELAYATEPLVIDPGTAAYTGNPRLRNMFRSTRFHATLSIANREQNEIYDDSVFLLRDRTQAEVVAWRPDAQPAVWEARHHGFERLDPPATHTRRIELDEHAGTLVVTDTVIGAGAHLLEWSFPLAPCEVKADGDRAVARFSTVQLIVESPGLLFSIESGRYSPRYGVVISTPFLRARRHANPGHDVTVFTFCVQAL